MFVCVFFCVRTREFLCLCVWVCINVYARRFLLWAREVWCLCAQVYVSVCTRTLLGFECVSFWFCTFLVLVLVRVSLPLWSTFFHAREVVFLRVRVCSRTVHWMVYIAVYCWRWRNTSLLVRLSTCRERPERCVGLTCCLLVAGMAHRSPSFCAPFTKASCKNPRGNSCRPLKYLWTKSRPCVACPSNLRLSRGRIQINQGSVQTSALSSRWFQGVCFLVGRRMQTELSSWILFIYLCVCVCVCASNFSRSSKGRN